MKSDKTISLNDIVDFRIELYQKEKETIELNFLLSKINLKELLRIIYDNNVHRHAIYHLLMTMKIIDSSFRDNLKKCMIALSDSVKIFRETTPMRASIHSCVQGRLGGNVERGACGSPAGGRMRATAAKERKKRKELLGGGRTPSLCPRHRHRNRVVVPRRRRRPTGKRQRRAPSGVGGGRTSSEGGENATRHCSRRGGATYGC